MKYIIFKLTRAEFDIFNFVMNEASSFFNSYNFGFASGHLRHMTKSACSRAQKKL